MLFQSWSLAPISTEELLQVHTESKMMRRLTLIAALFLITFGLHSQELSFSRVIDTVLVVQVPNGVQINNGPVLGDGFSPDSGKVWKLESVVHGIEAETNAYLCNGGTVNSSTNLFNLELIVNDGSNEVVLTRSDFMQQNENDYGNYAIQRAFPLWLNSNSMILPRVNYKPSTSQPVCVSNPMQGKVHVSLIEFNTQ